MKRIIISTVLAAFIIQISGNAQVFEYHPSFSLSSGLSFCDNMANELSFMLRNEFTIKDNDLGSFCPIVGVGYTNRTYHFQYNWSGMDSFSGPVYMHSAVLEVSLLIRLTSWRKIRKTMIPYFGINTFRFLSKKVSDKENDFVNTIDSKSASTIYNYRHPHTYFSIETGVEFVKMGWPRLCLSLLWELPIGTKTEIGSPEDVYYYNHSSLFCPRLVIGLRL